MFKVGCWTECEVAELKNGSVLMSSRNFCGTSSGYGPRLFARSDDGAQTWAKNWSAGHGTDIFLPDPYVEGSVLGDPSNGIVYFGNPSNSHKQRANMSIHASQDGGLSWPDSAVVYPGSTGYSDIAFAHNKSYIAALFESDAYNHILFKTTKLPI